MAKKKKKTSPFAPVSMPFLSPKFRRFDLSVLMVAGVIIFAAALAMGHPYKLDSADPYGFLVWFLLLLGHIPMELIEFTIRLAGVDGQTIENFTRNREALLLGMCDLLVLGISWAVMRFYIFKRFGSEPLRITMLFLRLIFFWGLFQLMCFIAVKNWSDGKVNPLHRDLKKGSVKTVFQK
ncbi:MAG: hypothetical protein E7048_08770 [Lentisphaerae bacterium]|nr:hypothetical protein [Lentisphaerota bacterium]MBR2873536.1 hypothetical protein [Lentisphaeria bacterium]